MHRSDHHHTEVRSLGRAVELLRLLCMHTRAGWRLSDLAEGSGLGVATTHRLLAGLVDAGLAARVPDSRRYTLGPFAYLCGLAAAPHYDPGRASAPLLSRTARALQGTLFLKVRSGDDSVCIARYDGVPIEQALMLEVGGRRPLALTAGGVAILIGLPRSEQTVIERANAEAIAAQHGAPWAGVRRMLGRSRQHGFGLNLGDIVPGICAVAVAVRGSQGEGEDGSKREGGPDPVAALSLALGVPSLPARRIDTIVDGLRAAATALEPAFDRLRY